MIAIVYTAPNIFGRLERVVFVLFGSSQTCSCRPFYKPRFHLKSDMQFGQSYGS